MEVYNYNNFGNIIKTYDPDPKVWILGDVRLLHMTYYKKYFLLLASTAAKKCILKNWKSENPPEQRLWINELTSYSTPEKNIIFCEAKTCKL